MRDPLKSPDWPDYAAIVLFCIVFVACIVFSFRALSHPDITNMFNQVNNNL
jgi:hypothetical protein